MRFTLQHDTADCGPACVRMICSHYGREVPLARLRTLTGQTREGVSVLGLRTCLEGLGMEVQAVMPNLQQLREDVPLPAILHWDQRHFVVLTHVSRRWLHKGWRYHIADPAFGRASYTEVEMAKRWLAGERGVCVTATPTDAFYAQAASELQAKTSGFTAFLRRYAVPRIGSLGLIAVCMMVGLLVSVATPLLTQRIVDGGIGERNIPLIVALAVGQLALLLGAFLASVVSDRVSLLLQTRVTIDILSDYLVRLLRQPITFFETKSSGDYWQRIADHARLQQFVTSSTLTSLFSVVSIPVLLCVIGWYSLSVCGIYIVLTVAALAWVAMFFRRRKQLDFERFQVSADNQNRLYELSEGIEDIKLSVIEEWKLSEWRALQRKIYSISRRALTIEQWQDAGYTFLSSLRGLLITAWTAIEVVEGRLSIGEMVSIAAIAGQLSAPLNQLVGFLRSLQDARISLERSAEVSDTFDNTQSAYPQLPACEPSFQLSHVSYNYSPIGEGDDVLTDLSFNIPAGKMTAIVGESGSGKTTLLKLLLRFYEPSAGSIRFGGHDLQDIDAAALRCACGVVMQGGFLFSDTLRQNILLGAADDAEQLQTTLRVACLDDLVAQLPLGLDTKIGSEGINVSGGERQRIMLARAVFKQPRVLILDEATSSLDAATEKRITLNLAAACKGVTRVVVAHRLSTVRQADNIIVLRKGHVVEQGTHEELSKARGHYWQLVRSQLEL